jgi:putative two-component system response regulator
MSTKPIVALIVEDSPSQAQALQQLLLQQGLQVLHALDGRVGVAMARQHQPDVIILDIQMPEMNGLEACQALKQNDLTRHIPIVMLTAQIEPAVLMQGLDFGAIDFIPKDAFSDTVLIETLGQLKLLDNSARPPHAQN